MSDADASVELTDEALRRPMTPDEREALLERERARLADPEYRRELEMIDARAQALLRELRS